MSYTKILLQDTASDDYSDHLEFMENKGEKVLKTDDLDTQQPYSNAKVEQQQQQQHSNVVVDRKLNNENIEQLSQNVTPKTDYLTQRKAELRYRFIIGLSLCALITSAWIFNHILSFYILSFNTALLLSPIIIPLQCWLSAGLFIIGHDAMHGSLAPFRPKINRFIGRFVMLLYAGIWWDDLVPNHFAHHRNPGTEHDPDFAGGNKNIFYWFFSFFQEYASIGQILRLHVFVGIYHFCLGFPGERIALFWAIPSLLSAFQLFYFGTYKVHKREEEQTWGDKHRARSNDYGWLVSLLTCFHFGYHHEHHTNPFVPWWALPETRAENLAKAKKVI